MKNKKILGYGALGLTLIALGVAFVKPISSSNLLIRARADIGNLSVSFDNTSTVESGSIKSPSCVLSSGLQMSGIKAYATIANDSNPTSTEISRFYAGNGSVVFSVDSPASNFRALKSIAFTYISGSYSGNMKIMWSSDNSTWTTISASCGIASQVLPSGAHYLKVVNDGGYARFNSFTLNYSCSDGPEPEKELSSISISTVPTKVSYTEGEYFDPTGLVITRTYSDSTSDTYSYAGHNSEFSFSPSTSTALTTSDSSVTITYDGKSCNQAITVSAAPSGLSGTYAGTYTSIEFTSSTVGTYIYGNEKLYFTYVVSGTSITFTYVSGDNTTFGSYRLFKGGSSPTANATGLIKNSTQISVDTYNLFDSKTNRTFTKS